MLEVLERFGAAQDGPRVRVDAARCVHSIDVFASCQVCAEECPVGAVQVADTVTLEAEACVECGACAHACPVGAFDAPDLATPALRCVSRIPDHAALELICAHHPIDERSPRPVDAAVVVGGCLAALGPSAYAGLYALGVERVEVCLDACDGCPANARATIEHTLEKARRVLRPWDAQIEAVTAADGGLTRARPVFYANQPPVSRRRLLHPLAEADADRQLAALIADDEPPTGRKFAAPERRRLLNALRLLPAAGQAMCPMPLAGQIFMQHGVEAECSACGACEKSCPTGALTLDARDDTGVFTLSHRAAMCAGCGVCIDLCECGVLERAGVPFFGALQSDDEAVITSGTYRRCARCGARMPASNEGDLCELCAFRRSNPFGSRIPERMRARMNDRQARLGRLPAEPN
ncbi:4Fe-4S dicluster domain-containing protein [Aggregatilinea lenta]|uniref:4Fe-4S dicluster domain-containing protein n=1 Tax=Aggregatilinea lenta TaxID=913108 RepID=UPI000E5B63D8|nr:4Fe-4S dicluster domain-containing protein [Aggregatilinea lenta]